MRAKHTAEGGCATRSVRMSGWKCPTDSHFMSTLMV